jgi:hypothetical protein
VRNRHVLNILPRTRTNERTMRQNVEVAPRKRWHTHKLIYIYGPIRHPTFRLTVGYKWARHQGTIVEFIMSVAGTRHSIRARPAIHDSHSSEPCDKKSVTSSIDALFQRLR